MQTKAATQKQVVTKKKFAREYTFVYRLAARAVATPEELLLKPVRARLQSIHETNLVRFPGLAAQAKELLDRPPRPAPEIGRNAMVSISMRNCGEVEVLCTVVNKIPQQTNRFGMMYECAPINGTGRVRVNQSRVKLMDD